MRRYRMSVGASISHTPANPERTATRPCGWLGMSDVEYQVWPSRGAMLTTIAMQDKREYRHGDWKAVSCQVIER